MRRRLLFPLLPMLALCLSLTPLTFAGSGRDALDRFLDGLVTLQANFEQSTVDTENARAAMMRGAFYLQRPGRFRWDYAAPVPQLILADGRNVWIVEEDLQQATQHYQRWALKGTPAAFLTADAPIDEDFEVIEIGESLGLHWLELKPRDADSDFERILLAFGETGLRRLDISDRFGQVSNFRFYDLQRNPTLDPALFVYEHADDWDLIQAD